MQEFDWVWEPSSVMFKPRRFVHDAVFGKPVHQYASPHWEFELTLPPTDMKTRRAIASFFGETEGVAIVNVYDPRVPVPAIYHKFRHDELLTKRIPNLTIKGVSKENRTVTVNGAIGDKISKDDPVAFTHEDVRHYYRSLRDLVLDGSDMELLVDLRPRKTLTDLSITLTAENRIKPTCRFQININDHGGLTNSDGFTDYVLSGVEFHGPIS